MKMIGIRRRRVFNRQDAKFAKKTRFKPGGMLSSLFIRAIRAIRGQVFNHG
jgi:hypothetical protein